MSEICPREPIDKGLKRAIAIHYANQGRADVMTASVILSTRRAPPPSKESERTGANAGDPR
jgi:hypothetical protein